MQSCRPEILSLGTRYIFTQGTVGPQLLSRLDPEKVSYKNKKILVIDYQDVSAFLEDLSLDY